jgi:hypothetical protein
MTGTRPVNFRAGASYVTVPLSRGVAAAAAAPFTAFLSMPALSEVPATPGGQVSET